MLKLRRTSQYLGFLSFVCLLCAQDVHACEELASPKDVLASMTSPQKNYATLEDYTNYHSSINADILKNSFKKIDKDTNGQLTETEIDANQKEYQRKCQKIQNSL